MKKRRKNNYLLEAIIIIVFAVFLIYFIGSRNVNDLELVVIGTPNVDLSTPNDFNITKYAGTWYELSRYDVSFEKGCSCVTAKYVPVGEYVEVLNSCFRDGAFQNAQGKAYFTDTPGVLMVQFTPFIKSDYRVVYVDSDYQNAIVTNKEMSALWLLSRSYSDTARMNLVKIAQDKGLDTSKLILAGGCNG